jgi:hypothetical protein
VVVPLLPLRSSLPNLQIRECRATNDSYSATGSTGPYACSSAASVPHAARGMRSSAPSRHTCFSHEVVVLRLIGMSDIVDVDLALTPFIARQTSTRNPSPTTPSASSSQTLFDYAPWKKQRRLGESRGEKKDILLHELVASGARIHGVHTHSVPYSKDQGIRARQGF